MSRAPRQQRAKATVDAIIEAGFISLSRHGMAGTTTRHIADIAGIGVGSLYEYFDNKEAVYAAMHQRFVDDLVAMLQPMSAAITRLDIVAAIHAILGELHELLQRQDQRYLRYARNALNVDLKVAMEPVSKILGEMILQYLLHNPQYAQLRRFAAMSYIFIHGGMFTMVRHLSEPNSPISFEELVDGLAHMVNHYVLMEQQILAGACHDP